MVAHVFISGFVQGVGFRQFVLKQAQHLRLTGWVRNNPDNRVEAVFEGNKENIEKMITICEKGPFLSEVKDVDVIWEENPPAHSGLSSGSKTGGENFESFEIVM